MFAAHLLIIDLALIILHLFRKEVEEIGIRTQQVCGSDWIHVGYKNLWALVHYLQFGDPLGLLEAIILVLLISTFKIIDLFLKQRKEVWRSGFSGGSHAEVPGGCDFTSRLEKQLLMFCWIWSSFCVQHKCSFMFSGCWKAPVPLTLPQLWGARHGRRAAHFLSHSGENRLVFTTQRRVTR